MTNKPTELVVTQALLPCPFCGKRAIIETFPSGLKQVSCSDDDASSCLAAITWGSFSREAEAIAAWNTRLASTAPASEDEVERVMSLVPQAYADIKLNLSDAVVCYGDAGGCVREDGCEDNCLMLATYCKGVEFGACAVIAALRPRSEREEIVRWLLDDGTRLDYEKQDEANREHPLWWAADMIERGDFKEPGE